MIALITSFNTLGLTRLAVQSLRTFAPQIDRVVLDTGSTDGTIEWLAAGREQITHVYTNPGSLAHGAAIEHARREGRQKDHDAILLFDSDAVVLSDDFHPALLNALGRAEAVGGLRSWGDVSQCFYHGKPILHAHCLAMRRDLFERVDTFMAVNRYDTACKISMRAKSRWVFPCWNRGVGPYLLGSRTTQYNQDGLTPLWAHLGRGTSFRPRSRWRENLRALAAWGGSPRARKIRSYQADRIQFMDGVEALLRNTDPVFAAQAFDEARRIEADVYGYPH